MFNTVDEIYADFKRREKLKEKRKKQFNVATEFVQDVVLEAWSAFGDDEDIVSKCDDFCYEIEKLAEKYFYKPSENENLFNSDESEEYLTNDVMGKINEEIQVRRFDSY
jgi:hypothetical protein